MAIKRETSAAVWWGLCIVLAVILTIVFLVPLFRTKRERQAELKALRAQEMQYQQQQHSLAEDVNRLENSPEAVSRIARDKFNMANPEEKIIVFEEKHKK